MKQKSHKTAKQVTAGVVTAASLLANTAVTDPATLLRPSDESMADPSHVQMVDDIQNNNYIIETDRYVPFTTRERICLRMQSMPLLVRVFILLPLWAIGEVITTVISVLFKSQVGQFLLHFLLEAAVLIGIFALVWKLLFPHVPLRKQFLKKNWPWLIGGALLVTAADALLGYYLKQWGIWRIVLLVVVGFAVLLLLYHRILDRLPLPERKKQSVELVLE